MMKMQLKLILIAAVIMKMLVPGYPVFAHGDEPRLEVSSDRMNPGGILEVRGVDFEREEVITLMFVNAQAAIPLGEVFADVEGVFLQTITLPVDLPEGTYYFLAITDDHNVTSPDVFVQGPPVLSAEEGGQGPRDEDDSLLAPMPTYPPGVIPGVAPGATQISALDANEAPVTNFTLLVTLSAVALAAVALLVVVSRRRKL